MPWQIISGVVAALRGPAGMSRGSAQCTEEETAHSSVVEGFTGGLQRKQQLPTWRVEEGCGNEGSVLSEALSEFTCILPSRCREGKEQSGRKKNMRKGIELLFSINML